LEFLIRIFHWHNPSG